MKKLLTLFVLILACQILAGQMIVNDRLHFNPVKSRISEPAKVILLFSSAVVLEAIGDGLYDDNRKELGKLFQASSVGLLVASPFILNVDKNKWYWYFLSYTTMRMALFDPAYNLTRGLNMGYTGSTSY